MQRTTMRQTTLPLAGSLVLCCAIGAPAHAQNHPTLYGLIDAGVERLNILGSLFSSSLFKNRTPEGHVILSSLVVGMGPPELAGCP